MEVLIGIIGIIVAILNIILFFKIWGMTNDVQDLKERFASKVDPSCVISNDKEKIEELLVRRFSEKAMRICNDDIPDEVMQRRVEICAEKANEIAGFFGIEKDFNKDTEELVSKMKTFATYFG